MNIQSPYFTQLQELICTIETTAKLIGYQTDQIDTSTYIHKPIPNTELLSLHIKITLLTAEDKIIRLIILSGSHSEITDLSKESQHAKLKFLQQILEEL